MPIAPSGKKDIFQILARLKDKMNFVICLLFSGKHKSCLLEGYGEIFHLKKIRCSALAKKLSFIQYKKKLLSSIANDK